MPKMATTTGRTESGIALAESPASAADLARAARERGDLGAALQHLDAALAADPARIGVALERGTVLQELGRVEAAREAYEAVLGRQADNLSAHLRLGRMARQRGDSPEALAHFQAAASAQPENFAALTQLAGLLREAGREAEAETTWRRILEIDPGHVAANVGLARMALDRRDWAQAQARFQAALANRPDHAPSQLGMGVALYELGRIDEAEYAWRRVLELEPENVAARLRLSRMEWDRGRRSEAAGHVRAAAAARPDDSNLQLNLGNQLLLQWRPEEAEAAFRRAFEIEPDSVPALFGLARCAVERGDTEEALVRFRAAAAIEPNNPRLRFEIANLDPGRAGLDWREELRAAAALVRRPKARPEDVVWAAELLLGYGVTGVVKDALAPLAATSPIARRFVQTAHQLERMGLAQKLGAKSRELEAEQLNAVTGVVERLKPGADTLVLVFSGRLNRVALSLDVMHRILRNTGASLVYLRDIERTRYVGGVVGLGADFASTAKAFRELMARSGASRLLAIGHCIGCSGALRYGLALGAEAVLAVAPRIGGSVLEHASARVLAKAAEVRAAAGRFGGEVAELYASARSRPRVTLVSGAGVEPDASFAKDMVAKVPGVRYIELPAPYREAFGDLLARGLLSNLLAGFVAEGKVSKRLAAAVAGAPAADSEQPMSSPA
ncbi:MAG TPA: tetratricopeptide repeat protein [Caulobacteraceae bacterium]|nr:tetratricopeptide repeat protein [Caulobacteraceae bacterium]